MSIDTADTDDESDGVEQLRERRDTLEMLADGNYSGSAFAQKLLDALDQEDSECS